MGATYKTTWKKIIRSEMMYRDDKWENIRHVSLPSRQDISWKTVMCERFLDSDVEWCDVEFDAGLDCQEGIPFCVWTNDWVYFPVVYDGAQWVGGIPLNPDPNYVPTSYGGG